MSSRTILLLDDDAGHRLLARRALRKLPGGATLLEASTLEEAESMLLSHSISLLLSDLNIAGTFAFPLISFVRNTKSLATIPVIVLSTSLMESDVHECYLRGANCYLKKAEDPSIFQEELVSAISFFLPRGEDPHG